MCTVHFVNQPTKAQLQLIYKLPRSYVFRHYHVIFKELAFITLPSYIIYQLQILLKPFKLIKTIKH